MSRILAHALCRSIELLLAGGAIAAVAYLSETLT